MSGTKPYMKAIVIIILGLTLAGCGGEPQVTEVPESEPVHPAAPAGDTQPLGLPAGAVASLQNVKTAAIQIQAEGTFLDPAVGLVVSGAGRGSGFNIGPSGLALTNNHVVTGVPIDRPTDFLILVQGQMISDADVEAAQHILDTFQVVGI